MCLVMTEVCCNLDGLLQKHVLLQLLIYSYSQHRNNHARSGINKKPSQLLSPKVLLSYEPLSPHTHPPNLAVHIFRTYSSVHIFPSYIYSTATTPAAMASRPAPAPMERPTAAFLVALGLALAVVVVLLAVVVLPVMVLEPVIVVIVVMVVEPVIVVMVVEPVIVLIVVMDPEDMDIDPVDIVDPDAVDAAVEAEGVAVTLEMMGNCGV